MTAIIKKIGCFVLALLLIASVFAQAEEFYDPAPFEGKRIGVQTGSTAVSKAESLIKNPNLLYYSSCADLIPALTYNKIDACVMEEQTLRYLASQVGGIRVERLEGEPEQVAFVANKDEHGAALIAQVNEYLALLTENGGLERLQNKWFSGSDEERVMKDYSTLEPINGTLVVATEPAYAPFEYMKDGVLVGFDMELLGMFCEAYGYGLQIEMCEFTGIIAGVVSGKYDLGASGFGITEERKQSVLFTDVMAENYLCIGFLEDAAYADSSSPSSIDEDTADADSSFISSIGASIRRTFIEENRWKEFVNGAKVTLVITVASIIIGSLLGFAAHMLCRGRSKRSFIKAVSNAVRWLVEGMPTVVLLMVLYYILLGKSSLSGEIVAIIGFSLSFSCSMHGMMESGEAALDPGQAIAAEAMGYKKNQAFLHIIFPQAVRHFLPAYLTEVSMHIKATAIVGYIAVVDITKVGDIIRGRTYDAFFPLIAVASAYFVMAGALKLIVKKAAALTDPTGRSEKRILGGAKIK